MKRALVTGAEGFVASALILRLLERGWLVRGSVMDPPGLGRLPRAAEGFLTGDLSGFMDWRRLLDRVDAVIHLAGRVHAPSSRSGGWEAYRKANVSASRSLAEACVRAGVNRLVFASSVKALGEQSLPGQAWDEARNLDPRDDYGRSKAEAERALKETASSSRLDLVILRLPLVYGPGMRANMARLFQAVDSGWPLPLEGVENSRSILYLGNLADALLACLESSAAAGETFHAADAEPLSTPDLVRGIARALGRPARLFRAPMAILAAAAAALARSSDLERLTGSLVLDCRKIARVLGWQPPHGTDAGLKASADWFRRQNR